MKLFSKGSKNGDEVTALRSELKDVSTRLSSVIEALEGTVSTTRLTRDYEELRKKLVDKQIDFDREQEKWARERRETEHMVGLQRTRAEQERELAVREAQLAVREGNLDTEKALFEERIEAVTGQLKQQIEYLHSNVIKVLAERLPVFNVEATLDPSRMLKAGASGHTNGGTES